MAVVVRRLRPAFGEGDELVAGVDERHSGAAPTQLYLEEAPVELQGLLDVADLEGDMVETDKPGARRHGSLLEHIRQMGRARSLEGFKVGLVRQGQTDVVEAVEEPVASEVVDLEGYLHARPGYGALPEIHGYRGLRIGTYSVEEFPHRFLRQLDGEEPNLCTVVPEDVGERGSDESAETVVLQSPRRVLPAGGTAEVLAREEHHGALVLGTVQHEVGVFAPLGEEELAEAGAFDALESVARYDLVGVDIRVTQREGFPGDALYQLHYPTSKGTPRSDGEAKRPITAVAAGTTGLTRCVRPPLPCLPSKLRLEVEAQRSPGCRISGFIPRHIEHPAFRHSKPASSKISSKPSSSACFLTRMEPGTTSARMPSLTLWPWTTAAAARRSSMRALVQEPRNTVSTWISRIGVPGASPMYLKARSWPSFSGSGTAPSSGTVCAGVVPQETYGTRSSAWMTTSLSNFAPSSVGSFFHSSTALSQSSPFGACGLPSRYSKVVSSGAMRPARAPPSMDMLHTVMRPSIERERTASPRYSITCPTPPPVPMRLRMPSIRSLAVTSEGSSPSTVTAIVLGLRCGNVCVARTCSTSLVPMPKAKAPNAPWVAVWLSPHTITSPGCVRPISGPMTWTMPWPSAPHSLSSMP